MEDTIGDKLKKLRIDKDYTQEYVGNLVGISKQTLYKYENGIVTNIPSDKIEALAKVFGVTPEYLMGWGNQQEKEQPTFCDFLFGDEPETLAKIKSITFNGTFNMEGKLYEMPESTKQLLKQMIRTALEHMEETGQTSIEIVDKNK